MLKAAVYMQPAEIVGRFKRSMDGSGEHRIMILAQLNGCEPEDIAELLEFAGVDIGMHGTKRSMAAIDTPVAQAMFETGCTDTEIGDVFGVSRTTVRKWRERHGLVKQRRARRTAPDAAASMFATVDGTRAKAMYEKGATDAEAAEILGVTKSVMTYWRRVNGVETYRSRMLGGVNA